MSGKPFEWNLRLPDAQPAQQAPVWEWKWNSIATSEQTAQPKQQQQFQTQQQVQTQQPKQQQQFQTQKPQQQQVQTQQPQKQQTYENNLDSRIQRIEDKVDNLLKFIQKQAIEEIIAQII